MTKNNTSTDDAVEPFAQPPEQPPAQPHTQSPENAPTPENQLEKRRTQERLQKIIDDVMKVAPDKRTERLVWWRSHLDTLWEAEAAERKAREEQLAKERIAQERAARERALQDERKREQAAQAQAQAKVQADKQAAKQADKARAEAEQAAAVLAKQEKSPETANTTPNITASVTVDQSSVDIVKETKETRQIPEIHDDTAQKTSQATSQKTNSKQQNRAKHNESRARQTRDAEQPSRLARDLLNRRMELGIWLVGAVFAVGGSVWAVQLVWEGWSLAMRLAVISLGLLLYASGFLAVGLLVAKRYAESSAGAVLSLVGRLVAAAAALPLSALFDASPLWFGVSLIPLLGCIFYFQNKAEPHPATGILPAGRYSWLVLLLAVAVAPRSVWGQLPTGSIVLAALAHWLLQKRVLYMESSIEKTPTPLWAEDIAQIAVSAAALFLPVLRNAGDETGALSASLGWLFCALWSAMLTWFSVNNTQERVNDWLQQKRVMLAVTTGIFTYFSAISALDAVNALYVVNQSGMQTGPIGLTLVSSLVLLGTAIAVTWAARGLVDVRLYSNAAQKNITTAKTWMPFVLGGLSAWIWLQNIGVLPWFMNVTQNVTEQAFDPSLGNGGFSALFQIGQAAAVSLALISLRLFLLEKWGTYSTIRPVRWDGQWLLWVAASCLPLFYLRVDVWSALPTLIMGVIWWTLPPTKTRFSWAFPAVLTTLLSYLLWKNIYNSQISIQNTTILWELYIGLLVALVAAGLYRWQGRRQIQFEEARLENDAQAQEQGASKVRFWIPNPQTMALSESLLLTLFGYGIFLAIVGLDVPALPSIALWFISPVVLLLAAWVSRSRAVSTFAALSSLITILCFGISRGNQVNTQDIFVTASWNSNFINWFSYAVIWLVVIAILMPALPQKMTVLLWRAEKKKSLRRRALSWSHGFVASAVLVLGVIFNVSFLLQDMPIDPQQIQAKPLLLFFAAAWALALFWRPSREKRLLSSLAPLYSNTWILALWMTYAAALVWMVLGFFANQDTVVLSGAGLVIAWGAITALASRRLYRGAWLTRFLEKTPSGPAPLPHTLRAIAYVAALSMGGILLMLGASIYIAGDTVSAARFIYGAAILAAGSTVMNLIGLRQRQTFTGAVVHLSSLGMGALGAALLWRATGWLPPPTGMGQASVSLALALGLWLLIWPRGRKVLQTIGIHWSSSVRKKLRVLFVAVIVITALMGMSKGFTSGAPDLASSLTLDLNVLPIFVSVLALYTTVWFYPIIASSIILLGATGFLLSAWVWKLWLLFSPSSLLAAMQNFWGYPTVFSVGVGVLLVGLMLLHRFVSGEKQSSLLWHLYKPIKMQDAGEQITRRLMTETYGVMLAAVFFLGWQGFLFVSTLSMTPLQAMFWQVPLWILLSLWAYFIELRNIWTLTVHAVAWVAVLFFTGIWLTCTNVNQSAWGSPLVFSSIGVGPVLVSLWFLWVVHRWEHDDFEKKWVVATGEVLAVISIGITLLWSSIVDRTTPAILWTTWGALGLGMFALGRASILSSSSVWASLAYGAALAIYVDMRRRTDWMNNVESADAMASLIAAVLFMVIASLPQLASKASGKGRYLPLARAAQLYAATLPALAAIVAPTRGSTAIVLAIAGGLYGVIARTRQYAVFEFAAGAAFALGASLGLMTVGADEPGMYLLPIATVATFLGRRHRHKLGAVGGYLAVLSQVPVYAAWSWQVLTTGSWTAFCIAILVVFGGLIYAYQARDRRTLYAAVASSMVLVIGRLTMAGLEDAFVGTLLLVTLGIALLGGMTLITVRREQTQKLLREIGETLDAWDDEEEK